MLSNKHKSSAWQVVMFIGVHNEVRQSLNYTHCVLVLYTKAHPTTKNIIIHVQYSVFDPQNAKFLKLAKHALQVTINNIIDTNYQVPIT